LAHWPERYLRTSEFSSCPAKYKNEDEIIAVETTQNVPLSVTDDGTIRSPDLVSILKFAMILSLIPPTNQESMNCDRLRSVSPVILGKPGMAGAYGLGAEADLLEEASKARVRTHPGQLRIAEEYRKTRLALCIHLFEVFEGVVRITQAGIDPNQIAGWRRILVSALKILFENLKSLVTPPRMDIGARKPAG
jgi:hypothetical protein